MLFHLLYTFIFISRDQRQYTLNRLLERIMGGAVKYGNSVQSNVFSAFVLFHLVFKMYEAFNQGPMNTARVS